MHLEDQVMTCKKTRFLCVAITWNVNSINKYKVYQSNAFGASLSILGAVGLNISVPNRFIMTEPASIIPRRRAPIAPLTAAAAMPCLAASTPPVIPPEITLFHASSLRRIAISVQSVSEKVKPYSTVLKFESPHI